MRLVVKRNFLFDCLFDTNKSEPIDCPQKNFYSFYSDSEVPFVSCDENGHYFKLKSSFLFVKPFNIESGTRTIEGSWIFEKTDPW